jgi:predicted phage tail protein
MNRSVADPGERRMRLRPDRRQCGAEMQPQMSRQGGTRWLPAVLIVIGALLVIGSIFADSLGFSWGGEGYGWKQMLATIVGLVIALGGVGLLMRPPTSPRVRPRP